MKLFDLYAGLSLDASEFSSGIEKARSVGESFQDNVTAISAKAVALGNALYEVGKQAAQMAVELGKDIIGEFADTEQLLGGVDTIFKTDAQAVIDNASRAYKTAGMSANEYMETVTGFSSSLLQGLNGDTKAAASVADMAIQDMSDNANKFGTNIGMIQNAYQGFAKDNYTMLDNLKLGYGGTQEEMARLINDSGVLGDAITVTANTVKDVPLDKVFEAIHIIQTEMDVTGTTAKEASTTISGSFSAFEATWKNVLSGMANKDADMDQLMDNLFDSGRTLVENVFNLLPALADNAGDALDFVLEEIEKATPKLQATFRTAWNDKLPGIVTKGANGIIDIINNLFGTNIPAIESIDFPTWEEIEATASAWWEGIKGALQTLARWTIGIFEAPEATAEEMKAVIGAWWNDTALPAIEEATTWALALFGVPTEGKEEITALVQSWWETAGEYVTNACTWALSMFNMPEETAEDIANLVSTWWNGIDDVVSAACRVFFSLAEGDTEAAKEQIAVWWDNVVTLTESLLTITFDILEPVISDTQDAIQTWWDSVVEGLSLSVEPATSKKGPAGTATWTPPDTDDLPGHATGLSWVPHDDYVARLHAGEAVLTRQEAAEWRNGGGASNARVEALLSAILSALNNPIPAVVDGNSVYDYVSGRMTRDARNRSYV